MSARQFSVRCATTNQPAPDPTRFDPPTGLPTPATEQLIVELTTGGLEEVIVVPDAQGERLTIRGRAPAVSKEAARTLVEDRIYAATLDLTILEPGIWIDERVP
jgi:hypothetical protein